MVWLGPLSFESFDLAYMASIPVQRERKKHNALTIFTLTQTHLIPRPNSHQRVLPLTKTPVDHIVDAMGLSGAPYHRIEPSEGVGVEDVIEESGEVWAWMYRAGFGFGVRTGTAVEECTVQIEDEEFSGCGGCWEECGWC